MQLAPADLVPLDGDLRDGHAQLLGEEEELDVEYPGREVLGGEDELCGAPREELEAALGVADVPDADDAEDGVEAVHEDIAEERALRGYVSADIHVRHEHTKTGDDGHTRAELQAHGDDWR